jgi:hypothetical protein
MNNLRVFTLLTTVREPTHGSRIKYMLDNNFAYNFKDLTMAQAGPRIAQQERKE